MRANRSRAFKEQDRDDDEDLDLGELEHAVAQYTRELDAKERAMGPRLQRVIKSLYKVSKRIEHAASTDTAVRHNWFRTFKEFDADGSGMLDFGELKKVVRKKLQLSLADVSDRDLRTLWVLLDRDGSGYTTAGEFAGFMRHAAARKLRNLVLAQADTFASPGAFSDGDPRFVNPDERTGPLHFARLWNEDVRGYKSIGGYSSLNRSNGASMGLAPASLDRDTALLRRQQAELRLRTTRRHQMDDSSVTGPRYNLTNRHKWRYVGINEYRQIELEEHKALRWRPPPAGELDGGSSDDGSVVGSLRGATRESDDGSVGSLASSVSRFSSAQSLASTAASTRPSTVMAGRLWLSPLDRAEHHWSERLTTVPTKSKLLRQEMFVEEAARKYKEKAVLHAIHGE